VERRGAEVAPDFITLGKPMGNGFPVAAVLTRSDLADPFIEATTTSRRSAATRSPPPLGSPYWT
jgi:4-aminobutyrate aminotransferase-like enzyme